MFEKPALELEQQYQKAGEEMLVAGGGLFISDTNDGVLFCIALHIRV